MAVAHLWSELRCDYGIEFIRAGARPAKSRQLEDDFHSCMVYMSATCMISWAHYTVCSKHVAFYRCSFEILTTISSKVLKVGEVSCRAGNRLDL